MVSKSRNRNISDNNLLLKECKLRFRTLFQVLTQGVVYQDKEGKIVEVNSAAEKALGLTADQLKGRTSIDPRWRTINEDGSDLPGEQHPAMVALRTGTPVYGKLMGVFHPLEERHHWLNINAMPLFRKNGIRPYEVISVFTDITDRKEAEDSLAEIKERLQAFADATYEGIVILDEGRILEANKQFVEMHGYDNVSELIGRLALELVPPEFKQVVGEHMMEGKQDSYEFMAYRKDKTLFPAEVRGRKFSYKGKMLRITAVRDISERKKAEMALKENERKLATLISNLPGMVYRCQNDEYWTMKYVSEGSLPLTGYHSSEIINNAGIAYADIIVPEDREMVWNAVQDGINTNSVYQIVYRIRTKQGDIRWVWEQGKGILDDAGQLILLEGFITDITERVKAESDLEAKNKELEQIVYVTSHDLRTPLVNIQGYSKELEYSISQAVSMISRFTISPEINNELKRIIDNDIFESLKFIKSSIIKMESLLMGLLKLSRSGTIALKLETVNMNELLAKVMANFEYSIKTANVTIVISDLPPCKADSSLVNQIFSNLIDNALKYLNPGRTGQLNIGGWNEMGWSVYYVEDNGIGIATEQIDKIFDIFYRLNPRDKVGEGLGLTIVQKMIERLNGKIKVESELGKGSRFLIYMPGI